MINKRSIAFTSRETLLAYTLLRQAERSLDRTMGIPIGYDYDPSPLIEFYAGDRLETLTRFVSLLDELCANQATSAPMSYEELSKTARNSLYAFWSAVSNPRHKPFLFSPREVATLRFVLSTMARHVQGEYIKDNQGRIEVRMSMSYLERLIEMRAPRLCGLKQAHFIENLGQPYLFQHYTVDELLAMQSAI